MRRIFTHLLLGLLCLQGALLADAEKLDVLSASAGTYTASWNGVAGRTYLIQYTTTLEDSNSWNYFPIVESGVGSELEWEFTTPEPELYLRLVYTDVVVANPLLADFDGDNITTEDELNTLNTDPFGLDSDNDGTPDDQEDSDGDGYTDGEELNDLGTDPFDDDDLENSTQDNPQAAPPGSHQLIVVGDLAVDIPKTESLPNQIILPAMTFSGPASGGPPAYLVVVAVDSDEFPEWTRQQSEYNDSVDWKFFVDGLEEDSGDLTVNPLHQSWLEGVAFDKTFRGYKPISFVHVAIWERPKNALGYPPANLDFELTVKNRGDGDLPTTAIMALIPLNLRPADNMIGVVGDEVESNLGYLAGERHFVSPKKNTTTPQDFVDFEMKEISKDDFNTFLIYEGDGQEDLADVRKRKIPRDVAKKNTFHVELNEEHGSDEVDLMNAWIAWGTVSIDPQHPLANAFESKNLLGLQEFEQSVDLHYRADFLPASMFDEAQDVPKLNEPNATLALAPQTLGASERVDMSRQVDVIVNNVAQVLQDNTPDWDYFAAMDFPANPLVANDDANSLSEEGPYLAPIAVSTDHDPAFTSVKFGDGVVGDQYSVDTKFREFARINIGDEWYLFSEHFGVTVEWRMIKAPGQNGPEWEDNGGRAILTP